MPTKHKTNKLYHFCWMISYYVMATISKITLYYIIQLDKEKFKTDSNGNVMKAANRAISNDTE